MKGAELGIDSVPDLSGIWIAQVHSNEDFKMQERVLVRVLGLHNVNNKTDENCIWANHCSPIRSGSGDLPEPDDWVYVMFPDKRDPMTCLWLGYVKGSYQNDPEETDTNKLHSNGKNITYDLNTDGTIEKTSVTIDSLDGVITG